MGFYNTISKFGALSLARDDPFGSGPARTNQFPRKAAAAGRIVTVVKSETTNFSSWQCRSAVTAQSRFDAGQFIAHDKMF